MVGSNHCRRKHCTHKHEKNRKYAQISGISLAVGSFIWLIIRTGTKPTRITYPCQRAALANSSILIMLVPMSAITTFIAGVKRGFSPKGRKIIFAILGVAALVTVSVIGGSLLSSLIISNTGLISYPSTGDSILEPKNATAFPASEIYDVSGGDYITKLINLMSTRGLFFYKSSTNPDGLIATDDVVIIKVNAQHIERGRTNTDLVKEIVDAIRNHPSGFTGEIVIADNPQGVRYGMDPPHKNNAEDREFGFQDIANMYSNVEIILWDGIHTSVNDFHDGDMSDGYVSYSTGSLGGIDLNYPKFTTSRGTRVSLRNGIWTGSTYEDRLKLINVPVLKTHGQYGVTASVKNYLGVISRSFINFHGVYATSPYYSTYITAGICGLEMAQVRFPTLTILDAIWINPRPRNTGSTSFYSDAVSVDNVLASTDPVALDYIVSKYVIMPIATDIGYSDLRWVDPDYQGVLLQGSVHYMLLNSMNFLTNAGYTSTMEENYMSIFVG